MLPEWFNHWSNVVEKRKRLDISIFLLPFCVINIHLYMCVCVRLASIYVLNRHSAYALRVLILDILLLVLNRFRYLKSCCYDYYYTS